MTSTFDSSSNNIEDQTDDLHASSENIPEKLEEQIPATESEETDLTINTINDDIPSTINSTDMVTAEASFTEATSADIPLGATRSSVARILVKPGQIFRVQVDNEVKEVHGKLMINRTFI